MLQCEDSKTQNKYIKFVTLKGLSNENLNCLINKPNKPRQLLLLQSTSLKMFNAI